MNANKRALIALSLAFATVVLDSTALSVAIPAIGRSYGSSLAELQWVTDTYLLTFAGFLLAGGRLADRFGSRTMLGVGIAAFAACSILCALSANVETLIVLRFAQGIAAAILGTSCFSLLAHTFADGPQRSKAFSIMNMSGSLGACAGPLIGGLLVGWLGWRSIFWMNLPIALVIALGLRGLRNPAIHHHLGFDFAGQLFSIASLAGLAAALIEGGSNGWTGSVCLVSSLVFVVAGIAFVVVEKQQRDPLLPPALMRIRSFTTTSLGCGVWRFSLFGMLFFLSVYFQDVRRYSSRLTGLAFLPVLAAPLLTQPFSGRLYQRIGVARTAGGGFAIAAMGALCIAFSPYGSYPLIGIGLGVVGLGGGLAMPALGQGSLSQIPAQSIGVASGVFNTFGQVGSLVGVAVLGALVNGDAFGSIRVGALVVAAVFLVGTGMLTISAGVKVATPSTAVAGGASKVS